MLGALGVGAIALSAAGCPSSQPPIELHSQVHLTLLHTSDIHSRLFPYNLQIGSIDSKLGLGPTDAVVRVGGAAKISHVLGRERARADRVLHLDGGDCFQGAPVFNYFSGEAEVRTMSEMGTDAMIVANHEFDRGALNLSEQLQKWSSFPILAANYKTDEASFPGSTWLSRVLKPWTSFNLDGLRVGVIGLGNLSTLSSLFEQPNNLGLLPLNTADITQFYVDLIRPLVDVVVIVSHIGLEYDEAMIANTSGIDVVLGGHNHIVLQPPKKLEDCQNVDEQGHHYINVVSPDAQNSSEGTKYVRRRCEPRQVLLAHSGAFAKYVGRLDLNLTDDANEIGPTYDPINRFEIASSEYKLIPITDDLPEDPRIRELLQPYQAGLDALTDLDLLVGYAPDGVARSAPSGGDSALGNMVAQSVWLRQGIQTDFSLTNTTGIRADLVPGPVTIEELFNVFPFDNSIAKMNISGVEVQTLFDFSARRSASRGCVSQVQIAGARVVMNCTGCGNRADLIGPCASDSDCPEGGTCDKSAGQCRASACAQAIYIGRNEKQACSSDDECAQYYDVTCNLASPDAQGNGRCKRDGNILCKAEADCRTTLFGSCDTSALDAAGKGRCWTPIDPIASYELATSNYLAQGGSGFRVLRANTTQFDTGVQQRDALTDFIRQGRPCGWSADNATSDGMKACSVDTDCGDTTRYACACVGHVAAVGNGTCGTQGSCEGQGRCIYKQCRDDVAQFHLRTCSSGPTASSRDECETQLNPCELGGEECKFLSCVDQRLGNFTDGRLLMVGK